MTCARCIRGGPMTHEAGVAAFAACGGGRLCVNSPRSPWLHPAVHVPQAIQRRPPFPLPLPLPARQALPPPHSAPVPVHPPAHVPPPPHTLPVPVPSRATPRHLPPLGMHRARPRQGRASRAYTRELCRAERVQEVERMFKSLSRSTPP